MCLACAAVAAPEVAVIVGGYAAVRFGRPVARVREALGRGPATEPHAEQDAEPQVEQDPEPRGRDAVTPVP